MTTTVDLTCAGPHTTPPVLGSVTYPDHITQPHSPRVLCDDCAAVAGYAASQPAQIQQTDAQGKPVMVPNPDHMPPGDIPGADRIARVLPQLRPAGWKPAHGYGPPSWAKSTDRPWPWPGPPASA